MMRVTARALALAGVFSFSAIANAQSGFLRFDSGTPNPTLTIAPTEIKLDLPMSSLNSANLSLLLAQAGKGSSLSAMKEATLRKYRQHLEGELNTLLQAFFVEEGVPLVKKEGQLSLHKVLDVAVVKHFNNLKSGSDYDLERGTIELEGSLHYQLKDHAGRSLHEGKLNISRFRIHEPYQVRSPKNGGATEDNTEDAINLALSRLAKKIVDEIDDALEADELRDLLSD